MNRVKSTLKKYCFDSGTKRDGFGTDRNRNLPFGDIISILLWFYVRLVLRCINIFLVVYYLMFVGGISRWVCRCSLGLLEVLFRDRAREWYGRQRLFVEGAFFLLLIINLKSIIKFFDNYQRKYIKILI